jgi:uncharacterized protein YyaL (SSP411 family)
MACEGNKPMTLSESASKNHLANQTSPYLLQHADNPVDWYPWGKNALEKAKKEDKPILVSIGYSACHWCHVMEHESFEDSATAKLMNQLFVCIKVDREERPDIDQIYMKFVQMTTGSGGWPLNVFLTPEQEPFYGGTYFPPDDRYGRPSWTKILHSVNNFYRNNKDELKQNINRVRQAFSKSAETPTSSGMPDSNTLRTSVNKLASMYDPQYGGLGRAPKFPAVYPLNAFLRYFSQSQDATYLDMVLHSLKKMAHGGIYDQLGGGFARYSVDEKWLVPHFEKMLYDNAQLVPLYLDTYLLSKNAYFLQIAEETLEFVRRELLSPQGGFYSSLDADSEGVEGKYYVWDKSEIDQLLTEEQSEIFCYYYGVTPGGNFEDKNILYIHSDMNSVATRFNKPLEEFRSILIKSKKILFEARNKRIRPGLDDKILTSWNGLMLSAFARAYQISRKDAYADVIRNNIDFLHKNLFDNGRLLRTYNRGKSQYMGYLDDYAFLIQGLLDSYEALFEADYLQWAHALLIYANAKFRDEENGGYFYTSSDQEKLFNRMKEEHDQSIPSATAIMMLNNLRFFSLSEDQTCLTHAETVLKKYGLQINANPYGYASYLLGLDYYRQKPKEIVLVVPPNTSIDNYFKTIFSNYLPNKVVMYLEEEQAAGPLTASLLKGKISVEGKVTAYVCHNFSCSPPVTQVADLKNLLFE